MDDNGAKAANAHLYWARNKSEEKQLTGEHKALTPEEAAALAAQSSSAGAAWNKASTWEEKNIASWAISLMKEEILPAVTYTLGPPGAPLPTLPSDASAEGLSSSSTAKARVTSVETVKGDTTYVLSRGKEKVIFELAVKLKLEVELLDESGALKNIVSGTLNIPEVSNDELGDAKMPDAKFTCDQAPWKPFFEQSAKAAWPSLKVAFEAFVEQTKQKWRK